MRRLLPLVLCALLLSGCEIIPTPIPVPTPSPVPIRPTPTFPQPTFTPLPSPLPSPLPPTTAVTPVPAGPTVLIPGPGPGTPSGPGIPVPATAASPTVTPMPTPLPVTVSVRPDQGAPGSIFTVLGRGWLPGEGIFLELGPSPAEASGDVALAIADFAGEFVSTFTLPGEWPGPRQIFLIAHNLDGSRKSAVPINVLPIVATPAITTWRGEYFNNNNLSGSPLLVRDDDAVDFDWGEGRPAPEVSADWFSVRWTRTVPFDLAGSHHFTLQVDDGARVWIGEQQLFNEWHVSTAQKYEKDIFLPAGPQRVRVEYFEAGGQALIHFGWTYRGEYPEWRGEYYNNRDLSGAPAVVRNDVNLDFDWGAGSPDPDIRVDNFAARWTRTLSFVEGTYRFFADADDGVRVWVDGQRVVNGWQRAQPGNVFGDEHLRSGNHRLRVDYYEEQGDAKVTVDWARIDQFPDWVAEYYPNKTLSGRPAVVRNESSVDFDWGEGSPDPSVGPDGFSARWTRTAQFDGGDYRFAVRVDDGVRLWVDDDLIIDRWHDAAGETYTERKTLTAGTHRLQMEYYENTVDALAQLSWELVE